MKYEWILYEDVYFLCLNFFLQNMKSSVQSSVDASSCNHLDVHCIYDGFLSNRSSTMFENCSKCRIWIFQFWLSQLIFVLLKVTCLVTLFDRKLQPIFGIFHELLSTRNVECDFFRDFQTLWSRCSSNWN